MISYNINDQFTIIPEKNLVNEVRLEPRLMKLLCLFIENKGVAVSREQIVNDIWAGYGGGDDGLTQAVSFLRKILTDTDKKIIETIPKTGYVFNASVTVEEPGPIVSAKAGLMKKWWIALPIIALAIVLIIVFRRDNRQNNLAPKAPSDNSGRPASLAPKAR